MSLWREHGEGVADWVYAVLTIACGVALGFVAAIIIWFALMV